MHRFVWIVLAFAFPFTLFSQDTHYWTQQFGTKSALLSGAVVAGVNDNSMVYYNPGALGFLADGNVSINSNLYQIENIKIENALGQQADFKSSQIGTIPLLVSGMLNRENSKWKIGYGILSPEYFQFKGTARIDGTYPITEDMESPGEEEFIGELSKSVKSSEIMLALGFSRKLNDKLSVGFSNFFIVRTENFQQNFLSYILLNNGDNTMVSAAIIENTNYFNVRYQLKGGLAWRPTDDWRFGLTISTPSLNLFGNGTVAANISLHNIRIQGSERMDLLASDRQEKIKSTFKSPLNFSFGVNKLFKKSMLTMSAQYYGGIDKYNVLSAEPASFVRPTSIFGDLTSDDFLIVQTSAKPVLNVAIGYEYYISESLTIDLSARTDNSFYDSDEDFRGIRMSMSSWDLFHITGGANISKERSSLTVGLIGSFGSKDNYEQNETFENITENEIVSGASTITKATYSSVGVLLGYTYRFRKFE